VALHPIFRERRFLDPIKRVRSGGCACLSWLDDRTSGQDDESKLHGSAAFAACDWLPGRELDFRFADPEAIGELDQSSDGLELDLAVWI